MIHQTPYCPTHKKQPLKLMCLIVRENKDHCTAVNIPYCSLCGFLEITKKEGWVNPPQYEDVRLILQAQLLLKMEKKLKKGGVK